MTQAPLPMVSGRYFSPNAPLLCLKWMPASAVTSVNVMGPEGREGALGDGSVFSTGFVFFAEGCTGAVIDFDWQPAIEISRAAMHSATPEGEQSREVDGAILVLDVVMSISMRVWPPSWPLRREVA